MYEVDVRDTLKKVIAERGYIQAVIAKKANLTPAKLSAILNKSRKLDANEMFSLCAVLQIEPRELLSRGSL